MSVVTRRWQVATTYGIVAASQPLAARAGVHDLFAIVYDAGADRPHGLNDGAAIPGAPDVFGRGGGGPAIRR